jgi:hypothetical protein
MAQFTTIWLSTLLIGTVLSPNTTAIVPMLTTVAPSAPSTCSAIAGSRRSARTGKRRPSMSARGVIAIQEMADARSGSAQEIEPGIDPPRARR